MPRSASIVTLPARCSAILPRPAEQGPVGMRSACRQGSPAGVRHMKEEFSSYTEREPTVFQSKGLGEGRKGIWIADQSLGGKIYGYRATLLTGDRRITVLTFCPAPNWQTLKPAFDKFILGLRRVGG